MALPDYTPTIPAMIADWTRRWGDSEFVVTDESRLTYREAEEKSAFDVVLTSFGDKKINVIKVVREITNLGLKEAKDLVDNLPKPVKEGATKEEAEDMSNDSSAREHQAIYDGFVRLVLWSTVAVVVTLVLMALFLL